MHFKFSYRMSFSHLSFFDRISGLIVSNQLGFPMCEIVFRLDPDPEEFAGYNYFYSLKDAFIELEENIMIFSLPGPQRIQSLSTAGR